MSKKRDIDQLLEDAEKQGFTWEWANNGHIKVFTPAHIERTPNGKRTTQIASTPRGAKGVTNARARLQRIGYVPVRPQRAKVKLTKKEGSKKVARLGDVVRVSGKAKGVLGKHADRDRPLPANQIMDDVQLAAWIVWDRIHHELQGRGTRRVLQGRFTGYEWRGSRTGMIRSVWPELDPPDYSVTPTRMDPRMRALSRYLTSSRNMAVLSPGSANQVTLWWVSDEWNEVDPTKLPNLDANWWESKVTPQEAGEDREPAPVEVTFIPEIAKPAAVNGVPVFYCDHCAYRSKSKNGVSVHAQRLQVYGREHPDGRFECPVPGCVEVRGDPPHLAQHVSRDHSGSGLRLCRDCARPFNDRRKLQEHKLAEHPDSYPTGVGGAATKKARANSPKVEVEAEAAPVSEPAQAAEEPTPADVIQEQAVVPVVDPADYLRAMLEENQRLRERAAAVPGLEARLVELEAENVELRARYDKVATWLRDYPFREGA